MIPKTLKDIKPRFTVGTDLRAIDTFKEQERQEAIEWYKDMEAEEPYGEHTKYVMLWIKIFFNLTKEELK